MSDELVFYTNPMSRGRIIRWMLEETGADYRTEIMDYGSSMKQEPYLSINPMGKVPAIAHGGHVVTECAAICTYLADVFPANKLAPSVEHRAEYYRWMFFTAGPVEQAITNKSMGFTPTDEQSRMVGYGSFDKMLAVLKPLIEGREFILDHGFSALDVYLGSQIGWGVQFGNLPDDAIFTDYTNRLFARAAHIRATEIDDALIPKQDA